MGVGRCSAAAVRYSERHLQRELTGEVEQWTTALRLAPPPTVLDSNVAIFGAGATHTARSCTEKRPSSRPLLLPNRNLSAVYMTYLLSYCAGAT